MKTMDRTVRRMNVLAFVGLSLASAPASVNPAAVNCVDDLRSDTGYFAGVFVTQIIQDEPNDPSSYVSDTGYFAGQRLQVVGRSVDCATN